MTESEIMKALECCYNAKCSECPYEIRCIKTMAKDSLDLINRKNAEIERLRKENALLEMKYTDRGAWYP